MNRIKAVFFDAGHTLIHAYPSLGEVYADVSKEFDATIDPARIADLFLRTFKAYISTLDSTTGSDEQDRRMWHAITRKVYDGTAALAGVDYDAWFDALYDRFGRPESWRTYPDAVEVLDRLRRRGVVTGVISNWDTRLRNILVGLGIRERIDHLLISSEVGRRKPDRMMFDRALALAGVRCDEAIHVGDSYEEDVVGASGAGLLPFLIRRDSAPAAPDGVRTIASLAEILEIV